MQDRATWHDMSQGPVQQTGNPLDVAIDGDGFLVVQTAARRALHPQRRAADQRPGELVTSAGDQVLGDGGPIVLQATDRDISITKDGTITVREGAKPQLRFHARQAPARDASPIRSSCGRTAHRPSRRRTASRRSRRRTQHARRAGRDRAVERARRDRDDAHDRAHARLHPGRQHAAAAERHAAECDRASSPKFRPRSGD